MSDIPVNFKKTKKSKNTTGKKKLTLKQRMALKKKKVQIQAFEMPEEQMKLWELKAEIQRTEEELKIKREGIIRGLKDYIDVDVDNLEDSHRRDYEFLNCKLQMHSAVNPQLWFYISDNFQDDEIKEILEHFKTYNRYILMKECLQSQNPDGWKKSFAEICNVCYEFLGLKTRDEDALKHILEGFNIANLKKKTQKVTLLTENELKFKKIVWSPELVLTKEELYDQYKGTELEFYDKTKEPLVVIFIGHVDSGKSTISGQILLNSGKINELEIEKLKKEAADNGRESWWAAYIMDINKEERDKGKTVDMGRACFETQKKRFTILDCPGHKNYVQNMVSGAAQADLACLVISARTGEFEAGFEKNGQTREHAMLSRSLGARRMIVLVNKMDTCNWSQDRFKYIKEQVQPFLINSCGFEDKGIFWVCIEGLSGVNIKERVDKPEASWYKGKSLFKEFDDLAETKRSDKNFLRIPILSKIFLNGVWEIFGKVESGIIKPNMECTLMPKQLKTIITEIQDEEENKMAFAGPGESIKMVVKDLEEGAVQRGDVFCGSQFWTNVCQEFLAEIRILEIPKGSLITSGYQFMLHMHTVMQAAEIFKILKIVDDQNDHDDKDNKINFMMAKQKALVIIKTTDPVCLEKFSEFPEMGQFAMRNKTLTVGLGTINKFKPLNKELLKQNYFFKKETKDTEKN